MPLPTSDKVCVSWRASSPFRIALLSLQFLNTTRVQYKGKLWGHSARDCFLPSATLIWTSFQFVPLPVLSVEAKQPIFRPDLQTGLSRPSIGNTRPTERKSSVRKISLWRWDRIGYPETSVRNYPSALRNTPEERRSQLTYASSSSEWRGIIFYVIYELRKYISICKW